MIAPAAASPVTARCSAPEQEFAAAAEPALKAVLDAIESRAGEARAALRARLQDPEASVADLTRAVAVLGRMDAARAGAAMAWAERRRIWVRSRRCR